MSSPNPLEQPCPDCGEMVRVNSVRCWNCAFMNQELALKYQQMQANPGPIILSEIPDGDLHSVAEDSDDEGYELSIPKPATAQPVADTTSTETGSATAPAPTSEASPASGSGEAKSGEESSVAHSVATGGDALLDIARQEEAEIRKKRKGRKVAGVRTAGGGFVIFCPYGCKIEVKESHRGKTGLCPKCRAPFIVPVDPPQYKKAETTTGKTEENQTSQSTCKDWKNDLHVHVVNLEKLKLKADSLAKDFVEADFAFLEDQLIALVLPKKAGGLFGGGSGDKKEEARTAAKTHLEEGKPLEELPAANKYVFTRDHLAELKVIQPAASRGDSIFHGIPVFGEGRIAIQLPFTEESKEPLYVSLGLTQFWEFQKTVKAVYGIEGLGADCGIPPEHVYTNYKCHFTDTPIKALENIAFYQADTSVELVVAGYRCGACGLTVSEPGRAKEKLGGKTPKGIAKAKCPKCGQKMGENLLHSLKEEVAEPSMAAES